MLQKLLHFFVLVCVGTALLTAGCAGDGGGGPASSTVNYSVNWAERSRVNSPSSALSFKLDFLSQSQVVHSELRNRADNPDAHTATYTTSAAIPSGTYTVRYTFKALPSGEGDTVGTATIPAFTVQPGATLPPAQTVGEVAAVTVVPNQEVLAGETLTLQYAATNSEGEPIVVSGGSVFFTVTAGSEHLTITDGVAQGVTPGEAMVTARIDGIVSEPVMVRVLSSTTTVTVKLPTGMSHSVPFAAYQDGSGAWQAVPTPGAEFTFEVGDSAGRYGVAFFTESMQNSLQVVHATTSEYTTLDFTVDMPEKSRVRFLVSNSDDHDLGLYGVDGTKATGSGTFFQMMQPNRGAWDLIATKTLSGELFPNFTRVDRGIAQAPIDINFDASEGFETIESHTITVPGGSGAATTFYTASRTHALLGTTSLVASQAPLGFVPSSQLLSSDRHIVQGQGVGGGGTQLAFLVMGIPRAATLNLPPALGAFDADLLGSGAAQRVAFQWDLAADADFYEMNSMGMNIYKVRVTEGWLGEATSGTYTTPDFSSLPGWTAEYAPGTLNGGMITAHWNGGTWEQVGLCPTQLPDGFEYKMSSKELIF